MTWVDDVEEVLVRIHPHFGQSPVVLVDDLTSPAGESVRSSLAEHVTNVRARDNEKGAAALPDLPEATIFFIFQTTHRPMADGQINVLITTKYGLETSKNKRK